MAAYGRPRTASILMERVDHTMEPEQLTTLGNEIESMVPNRAIQWRTGRRVFQFGNRTVVLR